MPVATYTAKELSELAGCSKWLLYELVRKDDCPFPYVNLGRRLVFPKVPCDRLLGINESESA